jgi:two-component system LytT family response regulator
VQLSEIIRCKSDNNYTTFYLENGQKTLVSKTLKYFADMLKEHRFLRIHQSHLIDTKYIKEFIKSEGGRLVLKDKSNIPVSVGRRNEVKESLNNLQQLLFQNFYTFHTF